MELGNLAGWFGVAAGLLVAPPQLWRILRTGEVRGISTVTYTFLMFAMAGYLIHAIYINAPVFIVAQAINLVANSAIFWLLLKGEKRVRRPA
mgnify:CR=1 FL=1